MSSVESELAVLVGDEAVVATVVVTVGRLTAVIPDRVVFTGAVSPCAAVAPLRPMTPAATPPLRPASRDRASQRPVFARSVRAHLYAGVALALIF